MKLLESPSNDAYFNMALEEYVFESLPREDSYFMLWQNANAIVVGKYQNTVEEINSAYVKQHGISVVRRLSGGGAMYQDLGNLNFTYVVDQNSKKSLDFGVFINPVVEALRQMGVRAVASSRNDIEIDEKKISGNSQYNKAGRTMHHGTLLFCSNLQVVGEALAVKPDKIESKGIKSVRSRVTNIAEHMQAPMDMAGFKQLLVQMMFRYNTELEPYRLSPADLRAVEKLKEEKYATWQWNYGRSPAYGARKQRRYPFGGVALDLEVKNGYIQDICISGDFFGNGEIEALQQALLGCPMQEEELQTRLQSANVGYYIMGMDAQAMAELLLF